MALFDPRAEQWIVAVRTAWLTDAIKSVTWLGSTAVIVPALVLMAAVLVMRGRDWRSAVLLATAVAGAVGLYNIVKVAVERPRPPSTLWIRASRSRRRRPRRFRHVGWSPPVLAQLDRRRHLAGHAGATREVVGQRRLLDPGEALRLQHPGPRHRLPDCLQADQDSLAPAAGLTTRGEESTVTAGYRTRPPAA